MESYKEGVLFKKQLLLKVESDLKKLEKTVHERYNGVDGLLYIFESTAGVLTEMFHFFTVLKDPNSEGKWWENRSPSDHLITLLDRLSLCANPSQVIKKKINIFS